MNADSIINQADENPALSAIVDDAKWFIERNYSQISNMPLQLYVSALIFSPKQSVIRNQYLDQFPTWIKYLSDFEDNSEDNWRPLPTECDGFSGFSGWVRALTFSSDGQLVASASNDQTVWIWNAKTGALHRILEGHSDQVNAVAFSSNNQLVASGSSDKSIRLWNAITGALHHTLEGHFGRVEVVIFSFDGQLVASASDCTVWLWNAATGMLHHILEGHSNKISAVAFSPSDRLVASASADSTVRLWNTATGTLHHTLKGHSDQVLGMAFSNDQLIASASMDKTVRLWHTITGALHHTLEGHVGPVLAVAFSPSGQLVASASLDNRIRLWDTKRKELVQQFHGYNIKELSFSADGLQIRTNCGRIKLKHETSDPWAQLQLSSSWELGGAWLFWGAHEKLLLPQSVRPACSAVWWNTLVTGDYAGGLLFFELSPDF